MLQPMPADILADRHAQHLLERRSGIGGMQPRGRHHVADAHGGVEMVVDEAGHPLRHCHCPVAGGRHGRLRRAPACPGDRLRPGEAPNPEPHLLLEDVPLRRVGVLPLARPAREHVPVAFVVLVAVEHLAVENGLAEARLQRQAEEERQRHVGATEPLLCVDRHHLVRRCRPEDRQFTGIQHQPAPVDQVGELARPQVVELDMVVPVAFGHGIGEMRLDAELVPENFFVVVRHRHVAGSDAQCVRHGVPPWCRQRQPSQSLLFRKNNTEISEDYAPALPDSGSTGRGARGKALSGALGTRWRVAP